jgi:homoserine kinase
MLEVTVPATLSNLGPGFDCLGLAVSLLNRFTFTFSPGWSVDGVAVDPQEHLTLRTARRAAERFSTSLVGLHVVQQEGVPRERGLGSSATARVAGMLAVLSRSSEAPPLDDQLEFLAADEGHPDNVVPALVGGLNIITRDGEARLRTLRLAPPKGLAVALCIPDRPVATEQARAILPDEVSRADALFNVSRVACLLVGLLEGRVDALALGVEDRLHQPWRAPLIGPVDQAFAMARSLGGAAPFISGSGSTLACFVPEGVDADAVADAMCGPFRAQGSAACAHVARPLARGALIS